MKLSLNVYGRITFRRKKEMHLLILNTLLFSFSLHLGCPLREHHNRHLCKKVQRFLFILQSKLRNNLIENVNKMHSFYSWWDANFLLITRQQHPSFLLQRTTTILSMYIHLSFNLENVQCVGRFLDPPLDSNIRYSFTECQVESSRMYTQKITYA